jgi:hypothetical protein
MSHTDSSGVLHGYEYTGATAFDPAGSTGADAVAINDSGSIAGYYADKNGVLHGFVESGKKLPPAR